MTEGLGELSNLAKLEAVRQSRGLEPINPFEIEGSGTGFPPLTLQDVLNEQQQQQPQVQMVPPAPVPVADYVPDTRKPEPPVHEYGLMVADRNGCYHGQEIQLSETEEAAIATIILRAIARKAQAQLAEVSARLPKRIRVRRAAQKVRKPRTAPNGAA